MRSEGSASDYAPTIKVLANVATDRMLKKETLTESRTIDQETHKADLCSSDGPDVFRKPTAKTPKPQQESQGFTLPN